MTIPVRTAEDRDTREGGSLGAVEKAIVVLEAFAPAGGTLGVSELARRASIPKSTTHRLLAVLVEFGLVERRRGGYVLGQRLDDLANLSVDGRLTRLRERMLPFLQEVYERTNETVQLAALSGQSVLYLDKVCGHRSLNIPSRVGSRGPAHRSVVGLALLAHSRYLAEADEPVRLHSVGEPGIARLPAALIAELRRIKEAGVAVGRHEVLEGATTVAAPVLGSERTAVCAISVTGPANRLESRGARLALRNVAHQASLAVRRVMTAVG